MTTVALLSSVDETVEHRVGREVAFGAAGVERLLYHYVTDHRKPFIHPLRSATGTVLTEMEPDDHPWHRGIWFSWKFLNGVNFWEEQEHAGEDAGTGFGHTEFAGIDEVVWHPAGTRVTTRYAYRVPTGAVVLSEQRTLQVMVQADGVCALDWSATFTAGEQPIRFDRTVLAAETPWGGYAGLSFRASRMWGEVQGLDSEGRRDLAIKHQRARWVHMSGVDREGRRAGLAIFDHPENPRYPSYWYYADENDPILHFAYMNPALLLREPLDLASGAALQLRYRILVHDGPADGIALEEQHAAFAHGEHLAAWKGGR